MAYRAINFFARRISDPYLLAAILSIIPITEIKGSILFAASRGENIWLSSLCAYLSSVILALILAISFPHFFVLTKRHPRIEKAMNILTDRIEKVADNLRHSSRACARSDSLFFGVYSFVAIPLPMTGIWAGALLASMVGLDRKHTFLALSAGNFTAGGIVLAVAFLAGGKAAFILDIFFFVILFLLLLSFLRHALHGRRI